MVEWGGGRRAVSLSQELRLRSDQSAWKRRRQPRTRAALAYYGIAGGHGQPLARSRWRWTGRGGRQAVLVTVANGDVSRSPLTPTASPIDGLRRVRDPATSSSVGLAPVPARSGCRAPARRVPASWRTVVVESPAGRETLRVLRRAPPLLMPPGRLRPSSGVRWRSRRSVETGAWARPLRRQPIDTRTTRPTPIHAIWRARRTKLNARPAPAPAPWPRRRRVRALECAEVAGTRKVANRTPAPSLDDGRGHEVGGDAEEERMRYASTAPSSQPARWKPVERKAPPVGGSSRGGRHPSLGIFVAPHDAEPLEQAPARPTSPTT